MEDVLDMQIELKLAPLFLYLVQFLVHVGPDSHLVLHVQKIGHLDSPIDNHFLLGCMLVNNLQHKHAEQQEKEVVCDVQAQNDVVDIVGLPILELMCVVLDIYHIKGVKDSDQASRDRQNEEKDEVEDHFASVGERLGQSSLDLKREP